MKKVEMSEKILVEKINEDTKRKQRKKESKQLLEKSRELVLEIS